MPLESATYVNQLDQTRPTATDVKSEGDDVMRLIKSTLKNSLPNIGGAMNASHTELNRAVGLTEDIQPRLSATIAAPGGETLNRLPASASRLGGFLTFNASTGQPEVSFSLATASGNSLGIFNVTNVTTFFTNGAERMRIDASGNVGIGTASPDARFRVAGAAKVGEGVASNTSKLMVNTVSGVAAGVQLFQDGNESWIIQNPASSTALTFGNSGTERMRIDASGNLIQQAPTTPPSLTVNGQLVMNLTSNTNLRISVRGSDGVTRVANITLA